MKSKRLMLTALALALAAAAAGLLLRHARPVLAWSEVMQALAHRETVHGRGWLHPSPGVEWHYALWARRRRNADWESKGMLLPGAGAEQAQPSPQALALCDAIATCWFPTDRKGTAKGRRVERAGLPVWEFEITPSQETRDEGKSPHYRWRLLLDPKTKLVTRLEILAIQGELQTLAGWCDYEYDQPLPPGFEQAPGSTTSTSPR